MPKKIDLKNVYAVKKSNKLLCPCGNILTRKKSGAFICDNYYCDEIVFIEVDEKITSVYKSH